MKPDLRKLINWLCHLSRGACHMSCRDLMFKGFTKFCRAFKFFCHWSKVKPGLHHTWSVSLSLTWCVRIVMTLNAWLDNWQGCNDTSDTSRDIHSYLMISASFNSIALTRAIWQRVVYVCVLVTRYENGETKSRAALRDQILCETEWKRNRNLRKIKKGLWRACSIKDTGF